MINRGVRHVHRSIILATVMAAALTGCDYWPPALLAQLEQLRNHVQDLSDDRAELEARLREASDDKEVLQQQVETLSRENEELHNKIMRLERLAFLNKKPVAVATQSSSRKRVARTSRAGKRTRVLALRSPQMRGKDVRTVQRQLERIGVPVVVDGRYGRDTKAAVVWFQRKQGIQPDGIVGPRTRDALKRQASSNASQASSRVVRLKKPHMRGSDVKTIQKALRHAGVSVRVDGTFGSKTQAAVKRFQRQLGLRADGIVGPMTKEALGIS